MCMSYIALLLDNVMPERKIAIPGYCFDEIIINWRGAGSRRRSRVTIRAVMFDWGDTVMRVFPEYSGPMAHWPRVEPVHGVMEALESLRHRYELVLLSNAVDSGAALVIDALERVGLDRHFHAVFTARDLGSMKPDPEFFRVALKEIECPPERAVMVGDDYRADIIGAKKSGMWAVWFNPTEKEKPDNAELRPDATIRGFDELDGVVSLLSGRQRLG